MTANDSKSYFGYSNKLVNEYNNSYYRSIGKKSIDNDCSVLTENVESSHKPPKVKVGDRVRITKHKNNFSKGYTKNQRLHTKGYIQKTMRTCYRC